MYMLVFTVNITLRLNSSVNEFVQYNFFKKNNIYKFSDRKSGFDAVVSWFKEKSSYNLMEDSCSGVCGHYTQVEHHSYLYRCWTATDLGPYGLFIPPVYIFCRWCGLTRNIWVVLLPSVRSSSEEEGGTIMFVTTDQGNLYKTLFLFINKWTKPLRFINTLSKFCLPANILTFTLNF